MLFDSFWKFGFSSIHRRTRTTQKERRLRLRWSRLGFERLEERTLLSATTSDSLALSWITPLTGQAFTMNAEINGTLLTGTPRSGTLTLSEGGTPLASVNLATTQAGSSSWYALSVPSGLPLGSDVLSVAYSGDNNYLPASSTVTINVNNDSLALSYSTSVVAGLPFTVNAAINGTLLSNTPRTGTLSLVEGTNTLATANVATATPTSSGYYALTVPAGLTAGTHNLQVVYTGDANYSALTSMLATVTAANDLVTASYGSPALVGQPYTMSAAIQGALVNNTPRTGTLSLVEGTATLASVNVATATPNSTGYYTLTAPAGLSAGANSLKVVYSGDANYAAASTSFTVTGVGMLPTSISPSYATSVNMNQSFTVNAIILGSLAPNASRTGTLWLMEGSTTLASVSITNTAPNASGYYALTVAGGLAAGTHNLTVVYSGDANYAGSTATLLPITVHAVSTSVGLTWVTPLAAQAFTMDASINGMLLPNMPRTGTLTLSMAGTTLASVNLASATPTSSGYYALAVPGGLPAGSDVLTITYSGDSNYASSTATTTITVNNDSLSVGYSTSVLSGAPYTVSVAINGALVNNTPRTGTLSLVEGANTLASVSLATTVAATGYYQYTLTVPAGLATGSNSLKVVYSGDANYSAATVSLAPITAANDLLTYSTTSQTLVGQTYSLSAFIQVSPGISAPPTGTLSLVEGSTTLASINVASATPSSSGGYTLTVPGGLAAGLNSMNLIYTGDANYSAASDPLAVTGVTALATSIGLSWATPLVGQAFTLNASVNPPALAGVPHTGTLTLSLGNSTLASVNLASATPTSSGYYVLSVPGGLPAGTDILTVSYSGDSNYGASTGTATLVVNNDSLSLSYGTSLLAGVNYTVSAAINGALVNAAPRTGTLSLIEGTTTLASVNVATATPNSVGQYALTVPGGLPIGTYSNLKVTYSGDANYSALSSTLATVTVTDDQLALSLGAAQTLIGQPFSLGAHIVASSGSTATPTGTLTLTEGTVTLATVNLATATPNSSGYYTLSVPGGLAAGTNTLKVAYTGDANYAAASSLITLTGVTTVSTNIAFSYATPLAGQTFTMNAAIDPTAQAGVPHTGTLTLSDNGSALLSINLASATPGSSGYYALTVPAGLPAGSNVLAVSYSGDANYGASTATATLTVNNDSFTLNYGTSKLIGVDYTMTVLINGALVDNTPRTGTLSLLEGSTTLATANVATAPIIGSGYIALTVPGGLPMGTYSNLKVTYSGDALYSPLSAALSPVTFSNDTLTLSYPTYPASQSLIGQPFSLNALISTSPLITAAPTGTLTLMEGTATLATVNLATATPNSSGYYALNVPGGLAAGTNTLTVAYSGDANFAPVSSLATVTGVLLLSTVVSAGWSTPYAGQSFTLDTVIEPTALAGLPYTGTLTVSDNGSTLVSINLATTTPNNVGQYLLTVPAGLPLGSNSLTVAYSGDSHYAASTFSATLSVTNDHLGLVYSTAATAGLAYPISIRLYGTSGSTATPTGSFTLFEGTTPLATLNLSPTAPTSPGLYEYNLTLPAGLPIGKYTNLNLAYTGDANYSALSFAMATVTVSNDTLTVTDSSSQTLVGQPFSLNALIVTSPLSTAVPTGTLTLEEGNATLATVNLATATPTASGYVLSVPGGLAAGTNTLTVAYSGDANYSASSSLVTITGITSLPTSLQLGYALPVAGQTFTMDAYINGTLLPNQPRTGTITLSDNGSSLASINLATYTPSVAGNYDLIVPGGLPVGSNVLTVTYSGDSTYAGSTFTVTVAVNNDYFSWSYGTSVLVGVNYTVSVEINGALVNNTPRTGTLALIEGTTALASINVSTTTPGSNGYYALTVPGGLPAGTYSNLKVTYSGDANYSALSSAMGTVTVSNDVLALSYASSQTLVGQPFSLNVAIQTSPGSTPAPTGTLTLTEGTATLATLNLASATPSSTGYYTLNVPAGLTLGTNSLQVAYSGDANYSAATSAFLTITGVNTISTSIGLSYSPPVAGQTFTMDAAVNPTALAGSPHTGTLTLSMGGTTLASINVATATPINSSGYFALIVPGGLPAGSDVLTVSYSGDQNYAASTATATLTVNNDSFSWSYGTSVLVGVNYTVSVAINGALVNNTSRTGTLALIEGTTTLASINVGTTAPGSNGFYALTVPGGLAAGTYSNLKVTYSGDANYSALSSAMGTVTVSNDLLALSYASSQTLVGQTFALNVAIQTSPGSTAVPTGTLTLTEGTATLATLSLASATPNSAGYYTLNAAGLTVGVNSLKVAYSGDVNYAAATSAILTITGVTTLSTNIGLSYAPPLLGQAFTMNAEINPTALAGLPHTGTLTLSDNGSALVSINLASATPSSSGYYALSVPAGLPAGSNVLTVAYSGDSNYAASTATATLSINNDLLTLSYASSQALVGQTFSLSALITTSPGSTAVPTGTLTLTEGTTTLATVSLASATPNSAGYYTLNAVGLAVGANSLKVAYSGDANYSAVSSLLTITGVTTLSTSVGLSYATPLVGQAFTMNAEINPTALAGVPHTGTLTLSDNGSSLVSINLATSTPTSSGFYALSVPAGLPAGSNVLTAAYSGDANYGASTATATLAVNNDSFSWSYGTSVLVGVNYTVSVAINGTLVNNTSRTGTLALIEGTTTLASINVATTAPGSNGYYALTVPGGLPTGTYSNLKVTYSGDANYSALSSAMGTVTVSNDQLALSYASSQTLVGQTFSLNVAVQTSPLSTAVPTGTLTLTEGTATLATLNLASATPNSAGYYTLNAVGLAVGANSLKVAYSGDANYAAATSAILTITGTTTLSTSIGLSYATPLTGQAFTMNAVINPTAQSGVPHTGTLTLSDNGSSLVSINLASATPTNSGFYALSVPAGLPAGSNVLIVSYSGDANYAASTGTTTLAVNNDSLALSYGTLMLIGESYTVSAAINGSLVNNAARTGTLSLVEGTTTLASLNVATTSTNSFGDYSLNVPGGLPAGTYSNLKVTYSGDANYAALSSPLATLTESDDLLTLGDYAAQTLIGQPYSLGAAIATSPLSTATPTGTLTLTEGTITLATLNLATATPNSAGFYTLSIPGGLPAGANSLKVSYSGDANYAATSALTTVTGVTTVSTYVELSWSTPLAGQAFTMNAEVTPTAQAGFPHTGTLTLSENGSILASINLATSTPSSSGFYALTVPAGLPVGNNTLIVSYSGDSNYATSTATAAVTVNGNDNLSWSYATSALLGVNYTVSVEINGALVNNTPRTGTLSLVEGTTTLASINVGTTAPGSNGFYALTVPGGLPAGTYSNLKVTYSGDANYSALSSTMGTVTVSNDVLALSYASSQNLVGQPFALNVAVQTIPGSTPAPTGTLTLTEGTTALATLNLASATPNSTGYYTLNVPAGLSVGTNSLIVAYSGDTNYAPATSSILTIIGVSTLSTSVGLSWSTPVVGQAFTMNADINPTALAGLPHTGTLTLSENGSILATVNLATATPTSSGYYALAVPAGLPVGSDVLTVNYYSGSSIYASSTATATLVVNNDRMTLSFSTTAAVGQPYTVNVGIVSVVGATALPTGTLTLMEGTTALATIDLSQTAPNSSGLYALTVPQGLAAGANSLKVVYSGDANFSALTTSLPTITAS